MGIRIKMMTVLNTFNTAIGIVTLPSWASIRSPCKKNVDCIWNGKNNNHITINKTFSPFILHCLGIHFYVCFYFFQPYKIVKKKDYTHKKIYTSIQIHIILLYTHIFSFKEKAMNLSNVTVNVRMETNGN